MEWLSKNISPLADAVTLVTLGVGFVQVVRSRPGVVVRYYRWRFLRKLGLTSRSIMVRAKVVMSGAEVSTADELAWLADALGTPRSLGLPFGAKPGFPARVEAAYRRYAAVLERGFVLGSVQTPVLQAELTRCRGVVERMHEAVGFRRRPKAVEQFTVPHRTATLRLLGVSAPAKDGDGGRDVTARDLRVSARRHRLVTFETERRVLRGPRWHKLVQRGGAAYDPLQVGPVSYEVDTTDPARTLRVGRLDSVTPDEIALVQNELETERFYDGVLPRLVDWRVDRDSQSGREVLHLSLAECTYSTVVVDHYPEKLGGTTRPVTGGRVGVLTLSAVAITSCGHLTFARRSHRAGSHPHKYGPAVNGNLEPDSRRGRPGDLDAEGFPDPRVALAREAAEELGLRVAPAAFSILGLAAFSVPEEANTNVLLGAIVTDLTLEQIAQSTRHSDPVEGAWEIGGSLLGLRLPRTHHELKRAVAWLVGSHELTPHATLAGLGALAMALGREDIWSEAGRSEGCLHDPGRPEGLVLELELPGRGVLDGTA